MLKKIIPTAALAVVMAASAANAQQPYRGPGNDRGAERGWSQRGDMDFGRAEQRYMMDTAMTGQVALRTSQSAQRKGQHELVRSFAQSEVMEQTTIADILRDMAREAGQPAPAMQPDPRMAAQITALERMPAGPMFDREYIRGQIQGHEQLLRVQEDYIRSGRNTHMKHIAMLARGQIADHLKVLREADEMIRTDRPRRR
jgi:predicted outer membrane protein